MKAIRLGGISLNVLWIAALISLPLTTIPFVTRQTGVIVAPYSAIPVAILLVVWCVPYLLRRGSIPWESRPLMVFILLLVAISAGSFFIEIPSFKGATVSSRVVRSGATVAVGLAYYFLFATWMRDEDRLRTVLRWITIGGLILVLWSTLEIYYTFVRDSNLPSLMQRLKGWLVFPRTFYFDEGQERITGLAYEPSWLSHQMIMLYLPLWIAATIERVSAFRFRIFRLSLENILLPIGLLVFFFSSPRISLVALFLVLSYIFLKINLVLYHRLLKTVMLRWFAGRNKKASPYVKTSIRLATGLFYLLVLIAVLGGVFFVGLQRDWRLRLLVEDPPLLEDIVGVLTLNDYKLISFGVRFFFLERVVYWLTGLNIFSQFPWFGVGLGNAGFFFPQLIPFAGWSSLEVRDVLFRFVEMPNVKSFWIRLLAESGLVGFAFFGAWFVSLWRSAGKTNTSQRPILRLLGLFGQLSLLAFLAEGFSIDSFAMPYFWITAGMVSAAGLINRQTPFRPT